MLCAGALLLLAGCSFLLPEGKETTESPWHSFAEAKAAYDKVIPGKTTLSDLKNLGFDPYSTANVAVMSYLDIIQRFIPNNSIKYDQLAPEVRTCLDMREKCQGYEVSPQEVHSERTGDVITDAFGLKRKTVRTGWSFNAVILFNDSLVVYKVWRGKPFIKERSSTNSPLGPLQNSGDLLRGQILRN